MIDLFPGMPLETRAYLLLALIGIIFFAGVLALGVGNAVVNMKRAKEYDSTEMHTAVAPKEPKPKKKKKPAEAKPKREKKPLFSRKKDDSIEMMAMPAGYEAPVDESDDEIEEEVVFAPTGVGETIDDDLPDDWLTSDDSDEEEDDLDDWTTPAPAPAEEQTPAEEQRKPGNSSPFGGGVGIDF